MVSPNLCSGVLFYAAFVDDIHSKTNDDIPSATDDIPSATDDIPPVADDIPPATDDIPPTTDDIPTASDEIPSATDEIPPVADCGGRGEYNIFWLWEYNEYGMINKRREE